MFRFTLTVAGETQMDRGIARFADGVSDYRPLWPEIYALFLEEERGQFASEGSHGGSQWAPLSPRYAKWKEVRYPGRPILVREGTLRGSLTDRNAPGAVFQPEPRKLVMGSSVPYALFHQMGTRRMPARPEIKLTEPFKRKAMKQLQSYLVERATEAGFRGGMTPSDVQRVQGAMDKYSGWKPGYMENAG